ncbi:helix-turn-helix transcriptional regulator [Brucella pituitosa]|uniref:Helix-turn-helix transcriptional regulator n=1 Tax=Brucella pituitosa TaxID=571256 RepID=A0A643EW93_9HYPH|nr:AraC family transcriptional regulator [Brucella pituitosa]KAB0569300.1 helix-turn-helix transcriptional regulator [Brucella pituitosa]MCK4204836.1 helix-turn-helix transcriptional regulator [Brucella pituitosa]
MNPSKQIETIVPQQFNIAELGNEKSLKLCASALTTIIGDVCLSVEETGHGAVRGIYCLVGELRLMTYFFPRCKIVLSAKGEHLSDQIIMVRSMEGRLSILQSGRTLNVEAGEVVFLSASLPFEWQLPQGGRIDCGRLPAGYFPFARRSLDEFFMRPIPKAYPPLKLLITHGAYLLMRGGHAPGEAELVVAHFRQVLPMVLDFFRNEGNDARSGISLSRIKAFIECNLTNSSFDLALAASTFGVTPRQVQKLFQAEETTFTRYVLERRLDTSRMLIVSSGRTAISSIAYEMGFGDLSYFNRAFRQRFGMTPSTMRSKAGAIDANFRGSLSFQQ